MASANGARVPGFDDAGVIAPGKLADLAIFELSHPRYFGLHDPLLGPVAAAGSARLRHLIVGGRIVVERGAIPGSISKSCATMLRAPWRAWRRSLRSDRSAAARG